MAAIFEMARCYEGLPGFAATMIAGPGNQIVWASIDTYVVFNHSLIYQYHEGGSAKDPDTKKYGDYPKNRIVVHQGHLLSFEQ